MSIVEEVIFAPLTLLSIVISPARLDLSTESVPPVTVSVPLPLSFTEQSSIVIFFSVEEEPASREMSPPSFVPAIVITGLMRESFALSPPSLIELLLTDAVEAASTVTEPPTVVESRETVEAVIFVVVLPLPPPLRLLPLIFASPVAVISEEPPRLDESIVTVFPLRVFVLLVFPVFIELSLIVIDSIVFSLLTLPSSFDPEREIVPPFISSASLPEVVSIVVFLTTRLPDDVIPPH